MNCVFEDGYSRATVAPRAPFIAVVQKFYSDGKLPDGNPLPWPKDVYDKMLAIK